MRSLLVALAAVLLHVAVPASAQCYQPSANPNAPCVPLTIPHVVQPNGQAAPVTSAAPMPVTANPAAPGTWTDRSGTVTTGGTSQQLAAANSSRRAFLLQLPCAAAASVWINFGTTATAAPPSVEVRPCGHYTSAGNPSSQAINVTSATTGVAFTAKEM